ncbi:MAG: GNAT family N-acetyltransferase [Anaerolineae bacterium]|jgi:ribosomal-protein-alanine N-acetyltransferase|nr:GNAT family N-acetyltransferase [Anaerolineae bacterium]
MEDITAIADLTPATFPILLTERLVLRDIRLSDAADIFAFAGDPVVQQWDGGPVDDIATVAEYIEKDRAAAAEGKEFMWGITLKPSDTVIGRVSLGSWAKHNAHAEVGYDLAQAYWRQGIGSEAVWAVVRFAFDVLRLHRVQAFPTMDNIASVRLLERLGFVHEGTNREILLMDDGLFHSVGQYSMLEQEYRRE